MHPFRNMQPIPPKILSIPRLAPLSDHSLRAHRRLRKRICLALLIQYLQTPRLVVRTLIAEYVIEEGIGVEDPYRDVVMGGQESGDERVQPCIKVRNHGPDVWRRGG